MSCVECDFVILYVKTLQYMHATVNAMTISYCNREWTAHLMASELMKFL